MTSFLVPVVLHLLLASFDGMMPVEGEIAIEDTPLCDYFAVKTDLGFSFLVWRRGSIIFAAGERIRGPLHSLGVQDFEVTGTGDVRALVKDWGLTLPRVQRMFFDRCLSSERGRTIE